MADQTATDAADWMQQRKEQLDRNRAEGRGEVPDDEELDDNDEEAVEQPIPEDVDEEIEAMFGADNEGEDEEDKKQKHLNRCHTEEDVEAWATTRRRPNRRSSRRSPTASAKSSSIFCHITAPRSGAASARRADRTS